MTSTSATKEEIPSISVATSANADNSEGNGRATPPGSFLARTVKHFWYFLFWGFYIGVIDLLKDMFIKAPVIDFEKLEKRTEQVAVMTGGPRGIGFDIVRKLLQLDYTVILGVRNIAASETGVDKIRKLGTASGRIKLLQLNLNSLKSVRRFASEVLTSTEGQRIDLLVNNAGIMNVPYEKTEDNFESHFQVNYLSHFLLTNLLLPRIKETNTMKNGPCHIIKTTSHGQTGRKIDFDELETSKVYSPIKCYYDSKLCQVLHTKTLQRKLQEEELNIHVYACHPGEIPTDLILELGFLARFFRPMLKYICRTTEEAATTVLYPVLTPEVAEKQGGQYFESGKVKAPNRQAEDLEIQNRLWERSLQLTAE